MHQQEHSTLRAKILIAEEYHYLMNIGRESLHSHEFLKVAFMVAIVAVGLIVRVRATGGYDIIQINDAAYYFATANQIQDQTVVAARFYFVSIWNYGGANSAKVTIMTEKETWKAEPEPEVSSPPTYQWSLDNIPIDSYLQIMITTNESLPTSLGFNAERMVSKEDFTYEDYQETIVTVSLTKTFTGFGVNIHTPFESASLSARILNYSSGAQILQPSEGLPLRVRWYVENPSVGVPYTFRLLMKVTPNVDGKVRFLPSVLIYPSEGKRIAKGFGTLATSSLFGLGKLQVKFAEACTWYVDSYKYPAYFWFKETHEVSRRTETSTTAPSQTISTVATATTSEKASPFSEQYGLYTAVALSALGIFSALYVWKRRVGRTIAKRFCVRCGRDISKIPPDARRCRIAPTSYFERRTKINPRYQQPRIF